MPELQVRLVTPFVPPLRFYPGVLVLGVHLGLGFEVHWLDCASVVFILLCGLFGAKKKNGQKWRKIKY